MTLSAPAARRHMHTRTVQCEGFRRDDGLWDIEGRILDTKTYDYTEPYRGKRAPGSSVHDMSARLTVDERLVVHAVEVALDAVPYRTCPDVAPRYQALVGACIARGWRKAVNEAVGGTQGCTHVRELLFPMATVAFQTVYGWVEDVAPGETPVVVQPKPGRRPGFIDGCHSWAADGVIVAEQHPEFSTRTDRPGS